MFERYTERARRVIFFARYEASLRGSQYIRPPHLLLALLREGRELFDASGESLEAIRKSIDSELEPPSERTSTSIDLPLDSAAKRVLALGAEEAERLNHPHIGTLHLLLGFDRLDPSFVRRHTGLDESKLDELRSNAHLFDWPAAATPPPRRIGSAPEFWGGAFRRMRPERLAALNLVAQALQNETSVKIQITTPSGTQTFSFEPNPGTGSSEAKG